MFATMFLILCLGFGFVLGIFFVRVLALVPAGLIMAASVLAVTSGVVHKGAWVVMSLIVSGDWMMCIGYIVGLVLCDFIRPARTRPKHIHL